MTAFQDALRRATPRERDGLVETMLGAIASHQVGDRFGRVEPRANKRRSESSWWTRIVRIGLVFSCGLKSSRSSGTARYTLTVLFASLA